mgnify:CR=1 FL=1
MRIRDLVPWGRKKQDIDIRQDAGGRADTALPGPASLFDLHRELNDVFDRFFGSIEWSGGAGFGPGLVGPRIDAEEQDGELVIRADLPGLDEKDIDVSLSDGVLTLRGERQGARESRERGYQVRERSYGAFYRTLPLPPGLDTDKAKATFRNGVLEIKLPKLEGSENLSRRIEVKAA